MKQLTKQHKEEIKNNYNNLFSNIAFINRGGCGVFAKLLYERLQELGYKPKIVVHFSTLNQSCLGAKEIVKKLERKRDASCSTFSHNEIYWSHVSIKVGKTHFDSTGIIETPDVEDIFFISKETLENMIADVQYWYYAFDRRDTNKIRKQFQKAFI